MAEAERRLRVLQERKRLRRKDKRELAALHQALASAETKRAPRSPPTRRSFPPSPRSKNHRPALVDADDSGNRHDGGIFRGEHRPYLIGDDRDSVEYGDRFFLGEINGLGGGSRGGVSERGDPSRSATGSRSTGAGPRAASSTSPLARQNSSPPPSSEGRDQVLVTGGEESAETAVPLSDSVEVQSDEKSSPGAPKDGPDLTSTASRVQLLVRMGLLRARLDSSRGDGEGGLRPVAESLWREVEELARSGRDRGGDGGGVRLGGFTGE